MNILEYVSERSRPAVLSMGLVLILIVGSLDYFTGVEISFSIFYLIPISLAAWYINRSWGIIFSLLSALIWLIADLSGEHFYSSAAIPYWNCIVRLGFFIVATFALSELSASQKRREELAYFIAHDLRAPLSNVIPAIQAVMDSAAVKTDPLLYDLMTMCFVSCRRMSTLTQSLLDLARLESGKMRVVKEHIHPKHLVAESVDQVSMMAKRFGISLSGITEPDIREVLADRALTERILVNLLSNAVKFSKPGSAVFVRVRNTAFNNIAFSVSDTGSGIPRELTQKVFDKFVQAEVVKARGDAGLGLGLAFCRLAVEAQGGSISLESVSNVGTTISFTLPSS